MLGRRFYTSAAYATAGHRTLLKRDQPSILRPGLPERGPANELAFLVADLDTITALAVPDDLVFLIADWRHIDLLFARLPGLSPGQSC